MNSLNVQAGFDLLSLSLKCWNYRCEPPFIMVLICISLMSDIVASLMYVGYVFIFFGEIIVQVVSELLSPT